MINGNGQNVKRQFNILNDWWPFASGIAYSRFGCEMEAIQFFLFGFELSRLLNLI